ncbi:ABC transporter permease [Macrococcus armenti]|uniref:ABC transporter permease n=1 Tax=Macrococcus armenti TaxID=2875764 RepID=UPI001CCDF654|nr:ABC transporter permease subunit [Macrococcus armenti]UBH21766.1 ABC transporter permease [Macrococcus armenti]
MNQLMIMLQKEWTESIRTNKLIPIIIVFMILGIMSPLTAIIMPDIIKNALPSTVKDFNIPEATYIDSYIQFFKNINQIGLIILVIMFSGILTNELSRGTLLNLITKGLSRKYIILSKWIISTIIWTIAYIIGALIQYSYTLYYFNNEGSYKLAAYMMSWLFGVMLLSIIMLLSTLLKNNIAVMLGILLIVVMMFILSMFKHIKDKLPLQLIQKNTDIMIEKTVFSQMFTPIIITIMIILLSIILSIYRFNKAEI